jgi:hypothetical protein
VHIWTIGFVTHCIKLAHRMNEETRVTKTTRWECPKLKPTKQNTVLGCHLNLINTESMHAIKINVPLINHYNQDQRAIQNMTIKINVPFIIHYIYEWQQVYLMLVAFKSVVHTEYWKRKAET